MVKNEITPNLIEGVLDGCKKSEEYFYNECKTLIKKILFNKYGNKFENDDDVSEIFIKVFLGLKTYDSTKSSFSSWVYTIVKNYMVDKWRCSFHTTSSNVYINNINTSSNVCFYTTNTSSYSDTNVFENNNTISYLTSQISCTDTALLNMKYVYGYDYTEIGKEFNLTSSTVSNRVNYIKAKLKKNNAEILNE